jgi:hypothetical protein
VGGEQTVMITESEAWTLDDMVRHTWAEEGRNVGQGLLLKTFAVIREFEARRSNPPDLLPIALSEEECWAIDFHIRRHQIDPMGIPVGRALLLKTFGALIAMRNAEAVDRMGLPEAPEGGEDAERRRRLDDFRRSLDDGEERAAD